MTAYETLGASCCKNASVSADAEAHKKLLEITGMPSLLDLATEDGRVYIRQCLTIKPEWFAAPNSRLQKIEDSRIAVEGTIIDSSATTQRLIVDKTDALAEVVRSENEQTREELIKAVEDTGAKIMANTNV